MSDVKRWTHHVTWDCDLNIQATMMALRSDGEYVLASDYAALEAELAKLRAGQEPVAVVKESQYLLGDTSDEISELLPIGTKLYTTPQPSAVPVVHGLDADDVRAACQNSVEVFAEEENAEQCREVAEYMREVLLADLDRAAPRQPEWDGLDVVAWNITVKMDGRTWSEYTEKLPFLPDAKVTWHSEPEPVCRLSDHQRAIAELRQECERLRSECARLESKYERDVWGLNNEGDPIGGDSPSGFANDLLRVTIERDTLRQQLAERDAEIERLRVKLMTIASAEPGRHNIEWAKAMAATGNNEAYAKWREAFDQRDKLAWLLLEAINWDTSDELLERIDAALAEVKPCPESPHPATT